MGKRATRAQWLDRVRAWRASGQSSAEFTKDQGYSAQSLERWAWKFSGEGEELEPKKARRQPKETLQLVEVMAETHRGSEPLTMRVGAVELVLGRGFDPQVLAGVLDVLEARR